LSLKMNARTLRLQLNTAGKCVVMKSLNAVL
jgi:hypothetical protein